MSRSIIINNRAVDIMRVVSNGYRHSFKLKVILVIEITIQ